MTRPTLSLFASLLLSLLLTPACRGQNRTVLGKLREARKAAAKLMEDGNYKEALTAYAELTTRQRWDGLELVVEDLREGLTCIGELGQDEAFDTFVGNAVRAQRGNWRLLAAAADGYRQADHRGTIVGGEFQRGQRPDHDEWHNVHERDRVRALQFMRDAELLARRERNQRGLSQFYRDCAKLHARQGSQSWRMQTLTDLDELPDVARGYDHDGGARNGAPVDADGKPVLYPVPKSLQAAANDGERWRWLLARSEQVSPKWASRARLDLAQFLYQQFGVQTMRRDSWFLGPRDDEAGPRTFDLRTLAKDETICQLATGIQRIRLPGEFSYIRLFEKLADGPSPGVREPACLALATIYENRQQYDTAVAWWERYKEYDEEEVAEGRIQQIVGNWGRFEELPPQPAGPPATVDFRFRNGKSVEFTAYRIDMGKVLGDIVAHVKSRPGRLIRRQVDPGLIGRRLVYANETKYIAGKVAQWSLPLAPKPHHFDRRITVTTPLRKGGIYLLVGEMRDGNTTRILVQLDDLVIARKDMGNRLLYYVADAITGTPVEGKLAFFGFRSQPEDDPVKRRAQYKQIVTGTDSDGQCQIAKGRLSEGYHWLIVARAGKRLAWHGLSEFWLDLDSRHRPRKTKAFVITDRPVYRPGHTIQWKAWVRHAQYDMGDTSQFASRAIGVRIYNARDEKIHDETQVADEYGGVNGELKLGEGAALGVYSIFLSRGHGRGSH
ncbi:MAG: hypothetical protein HN380_29010, partial [Victivallales bacterium]|nr:hypothetical protein [Victivallales bacterium]